MLQGDGIYRRSVAQGRTTRAIAETLPGAVTASGLVGSTVRVTAAGIVSPAGTLTASGLRAGSLEADDASAPPRPLRPCWPSLVPPPVTLRRRSE